jgi:hypothetical protein
MRPIRSAAIGCALWLLGMATPAHAAWCNVFQVCWHPFSKSTVSSYYAAPSPCCSSPCQTCTTQYVQRCYYQPVTTYETRSYYESVTSYRTSYYYQPVTSYRYSSYYDPCTGCCQQVACPTTCYQLKSQCCPVQSWVQRCYQAPVTTYRQSSYWEPVTTCSAPPPCCGTPAPAPSCCGTATPAVSQYSTTAPQAGVGEQRLPAGPDRGSNYQNPPAKEQNPPASGSSLRPTQAPLAPPTVKLNQIVAIPDMNAADNKVVMLEKSK